MEGNTIPEMLGTFLQKSFNDQKLKIKELEAKVEKKCIWVRVFDNHFNIGCVNETGERANGNFKGKKDGAKWEFIFCPYCGSEIELTQQPKEPTPKTKEVKFYKSLNQLE